MNNKIEITATCSHVGEIESIGQNGFKKRTFVLKDKSGQYSKILAFTLKKDKVDKIDRRSVGKTVKVVGYVESREWQGKYYTEVTAIDVEVVSAAKASTVEDELPISDDTISDDIPF
jgi:aspartyl/asparaginyl-tRNA synthetase